MHRSFRRLLPLTVALAGVALAGCVAYPAPYGYGGYYGAPYGYGYGYAPAPVFGFNFGGWGHDGWHGRDRWEDRR